MNDDKRITHESFGVVSTSRYSNISPQRFFGTSIKTASFVEFKVHTADISTSMGRPYVHADKLLIQFRMTRQDMFDLFSLPNGPYIPCTLESVGGQSLEDVPDNHALLEYELNRLREGLDHTNTVKKAKENLLEVTEKLPKSKQAKIGNIVDRMGYSSGDNISYHITNMVDILHKASVRADTSEESSEEIKELLQKLLDKLNA
jgi:hypothetical protein